MANFYFVLKKDSSAQHNSSPKTEYKSQTQSNILEKKKASGCLYFRRVFVTPFSFYFVWTAKRF